MTEAGAINTSATHSSPKMDGSSKKEQNRLRIHNIIRRAKTENNATFNTTKTTSNAENGRKSSAGLYIIEEEKPVPAPKTKREFVTESMNDMAPHDMIAMLELFAQADNNFAFEALQGFKSSPAEKIKQSSKQRRNSSHVQSTPRLTKESSNLRASV